jgi:hypothetical protein
MSSRPMSATVTMSVVVISQRARMRSPLSATVTLFVARKVAAWAR